METGRTTTFIARCISTLVLPTQRLRLSCGCFPNAKSQAGLTCYHLAAAMASPQLASFLLYRGVYTNRFSEQEHAKLQQALQKRLQQQATLNPPAGVNASADETKQASSLNSSYPGKPFAGVTFDERRSQQLSARESQKDPSLEFGENEGTGGWLFSSKESPLQAHVSNTPDTAKGCAVYVV